MHVEESERAFLGMVEHLLKGRSEGLFAKSFLLCLLLLCTGASAEARPARNVILFLGDAGGLPTLNAAGIYAHGRPQSLFIHSLPHIGLSETSALNRWVTGSAAGMTAVMTGRKTDSRMLSVVPSTGSDRFVPVKTVLEYAEQRGLSTGVITNMPIWDATPAACYAHVGDRSEKDEIFYQLLAPRFGDGVDIVIGKGRKDAEVAFAKRGMSATQAFAGAGYSFSDDPSVLTGGTKRVAVLRDEDFSPIPAVEGAIANLSRNQKGYFLMVEWDMHTSDLKKGLRHVVEMDDLIRRVSKIAGPDTLILFTADHSYNLKLLSGDRDRPLADQVAADNPDHPRVIAADTKGAHAGEEVIAGAMGPGAERIRGFFPNTQLFTVMMAALGWEPDR